MGQYDVGALTVARFLQDLASDRPTPGGGTGAAVAGAMGAALVRMLAALTIGRPKYAEHEELMRAVADDAGAAGEALLELAAKDAAAYERVGDAYRMPKGTDEEKAARTRAVQEALKGAIEVPLQVMERCVEVIGLAKNAVFRGNRNALSDGAAGAELCRAALRVAAYNAKINLAGVEDAAYRKWTRTRLDEMAYMAQGAANEIDSFVQEQWKTT